MSRPRWIEYTRRKIVQECFLFLFVCFPGNTYITSRVKSVSFGFAYLKDSSWGEHHRPLYVVPFFFSKQKLDKLQSEGEGSAWSAAVNTKCDSC